MNTKLYLGFLLVLGLLGGVFGSTSPFTTGPNGEEAELYVSTEDEYELYPVFKQEGIYYTYVKDPEGSGGIPIGGVNYKYVDLGSNVEKIIENSDGYILSISQASDSQASDSQASLDLDENQIWIEALESSNPLSDELKEQLYEYSKDFDSIIELKTENEELYNIIFNSLEEKYNDDSFFTDLNSFDDFGKFEDLFNLKENSDYGYDLSVLYKLKSNGFEVNSKQYSSYFKTYSNAKSDLEDFEKTYLTKYANCKNDDICKKNLDNKLDDLREDYNDEVEKMRKYIDSEAAYDYVLSECGKEETDGLSCADMITAFSDGLSCSDSFFPEDVCTFFSDERLVEESVAQEMRDYGEEKKKYCSTQTDKSYEDCYNEALEMKFDDIKIEFQEKAFYCEKSLGLCSDDELKPCESNPDDCNKYGMKCKSDDSACKLLKKEFEEKEDYISRNSYVETSAVFDAISALMNPDQNAIAASRLFGFEADTSDLPPWLTYDTASYICLAKIDGYLDTQIESTQEDSVGNTGTTGTTQYGCSIEMEYEYDSTTGSYVQNEGHPCLEVIADLRGERSGILPDGSILVTYSGYIKAPPSLNITYDLYIAYLDNMSRTQFVDLNTLNEDGLAFKKINAGGEDSFYSAISIPVDGSSSLKKNLGNNDVKIGIIAYFENSNQEYVNILTPAYEISADIYVDPLGQDQESSNTNNNQNDEDNTEDEEEDTMDSDQVTNNRCKSTGQC